MNYLKQNLKHFLFGMDVYDPVHRAWARRQEVRLAFYNIGYRLVGGDDHYPLPPTRLIQQVQINGEIAVYLRSGSQGKVSIQNMLTRNGYHIEDFNRILDFGCGCGRIMRQWTGLCRQRLFGTDLNPELIRWCQEKPGKLAEFKTNPLTPPLDYPDEYFDLIYS